MTRSLHIYGREFEFVPHKFQPQTLVLRLFMAETSQVALRHLWHRIEPALNSRTESASIRASGLPTGTASWAKC